jgi:hypothetical protein
LNTRAVAARSVSKSVERQRRGGAKSKEPRRWGGMVGAWFMGDCVVRSRLQRSCHAKKTDVLVTE